MISVFRRHLQGRLLRYTIYFVGLLVIFPSVFITFFTRDQSYWFMKINGVTIDYAEFVERQRLLERRFAEQKRGDLQAVVQEELFMRALTRSTAERLGVSLSPRAVNDELRRQLPAQFWASDGTLDQNALARSGLVFEKIYRDTESTMIDEQLQQLLMGAIYVPSFMVNDAFIAGYVNHSFSVATFPLGRFVEQAKQQPVTEKELRDFFAAENRKSKRYVVPERRSGIVWTFDAGSYGITIAEEALKNYYNKHKMQQYMATPVKIQVRHIVEPVAASGRADVISTMNALRQELLQRPELFAQRGKLLDFFARGTHGKELEQVAFRLEKEGDVSQVFETKEGFNIVQLVARKSPTYKPFESVRDDIVKTMRLDKFKSSFVSMARGALIQEDRVKAIEEFARIRGGRQEAIAEAKLGNDATAKIQKLFTLSKDRAAAFLDGDKGVLVLTTDVKRLYEPAFEQVKAQVVNDYYHMRATNALRALLAQADKISSVEQFKQFAREHGGRIEATGWVNKQDKEKSKKLREQLGDAFDRVFAMQVPGSVAVYRGSDAGYAVCLEGIGAVNEQELKEHTPALLFDTFRTQSLLVAHGFVASLCKNATIKVNEKLRINKG